MCYVLGGRILSAESNALTLSKDILQRYSKLQVETVIPCPGQADSDCSSWDHCITIAFRCAAEESHATHMEFSDQRIHKLSSQPLLYAHNEIFQKAYVSSYLNLTLPSNNDLHRRLEVGGDARELVRYVTPFRRRNGHWLTDISPLVALLQQLRVYIRGFYLVVCASLRHTKRRSPSGLHRPRAMYKEIRI